LKKGGGGGGAKRSRNPQRKSSRILFKAKGKHPQLYIIKIHLYKFTEVKRALKGQVTRAVTSFGWPAQGGGAHETGHEDRVRDRSGLYTGRSSIRQLQFQNTLNRFYFRAPHSRRRGNLKISRPQLMAKPTLHARYYSTQSLPADIQIKQ
jgi:hypothetical protein